MRTILAATAIALASIGPARAICFGDDPACEVEELRQDIRKELATVYKGLDTCYMSDEHQDRMIDRLMTMIEKLDARILALELGPIARPKKP